MFEKFVKMFEICQKIENVLLFFEKYTLVCLILKYDFPNYNFLVKIFVLRILQCFKNVKVGLSI